MELSTMTMFRNNSTTDVDNNSSDDFNASVLHSNESHTSVTEESAPSYWSMGEVIRLLHIIIRPILIVFGTYGNAVSFYIMRRGSLKKVSTCFYMAMLAVADTLFLWTGCFLSWLGTLTNYRINPFTWLDCRVMLFLAAFSSQCSSCLLVVMCIEKFFALYFPLKMRSICTVAMAKKVTFVLGLCLVVINSPRFFIYKSSMLPDGSKYCKLVNVPESYQLIEQQIEYSLYSFGPFTIMVLTNGAIIYKFMQASCARNQGGTESTNQALSKSANKGTAMLITVSLVFLILTGPVAVSLAMSTSADPIQRFVFIIMRYFNHSINAVLYCMSGSRFRNELMKTFPFRLCRKDTNLHSGFKSVSSLTANSISATATFTVSVGASAN